MNITTIKKSHSSTDTESMNSSPNGSKCAAPTGFEEQSERKSTDEDTIDLLQSDNEVFVVDKEALDTEDSTIILSDEEDETCMKMVYVDEVMNKNGEEYEVKLSNGQILSLKADLLSPELIDEYENEKGKREEETETVVTMEDRTSKFEFEYSQITFPRDNEGNVRWYDFDEVKSAASGFQIRDSFIQEHGNFDLEGHYNQGRKILKRIHPSSSHFQNF